LFFFKRLVLTLGKFGFNVGEVLNPMQST
jgi:hypothetical protein